MNLRPATAPRLLLPALILLMSGCSLMPDYPARYLEAPLSSAAEELQEPDEEAISSEELESVSRDALLALLYQRHDDWRGVKYRRGGMSRQGTDCSGFAKLTFAELFDIKLPRDTHKQSRTGNDVAREALRTGDLVFFRINKSTQHVGIYLEEGKFLHASTSRGVMISNMSHPYWDKRYWKSVRHEEVMQRAGLQSEAQPG